MCERASSSCSGSSIGYRSLEGFFPMEGNRRGLAEAIHNPHDKLFKHLLGERENAASFLGSNLPESIVRHLALDSLEVLQASFIDAQYVQSEADLLFSVSVAGHTGFVYVLLEHQSKPDR